MSDHDLVSLLSCLCGCLLVALFCLLDRPRPEYVPLPRKQRRIRAWARRTVQERKQAEKPRNEPWLDEPTGLVLVSWSDLPMFDWDLKTSPDDQSDGHDFSTREEVLEHVLGVAAREHMTFRLYWTPGGVRGFLVSAFCGCMQHWEELAQRLRCDSRYVACCREAGCWNCRMSPKRGRDGDYVAAYWTTVGPARTQSSRMSRIEKHDRLVARHRGAIPPVTRILPDLTVALLFGVESEPWEAVTVAALRDHLAEDGMETRPVKGEVNVEIPF